MTATIDNHLQVIEAPVRLTPALSFGALMVPWCGMWLGIETDGYTHS